MPVINGLTNEYHPCQILADIYTFIEHRGAIKGKTVAWIGDSNNVCNTWLQAAEIFDFNVHVSTPPGYEVEAGTGGLYEPTTTRSSRTRWKRRRAPTSSPPTSGPAWASRPRTRSASATSQDWQVDAEMMKAAKKDALFMHCLPAHRGEEVAAEVIDGPQSVVWDEAENRLHTQKALMEFLLLGKVDSASEVRRRDYWAFVIAVIVFLAIPGVGNLAIITSTTKGRSSAGWRRRSA